MTSVRVFAQGRPQHKSGHRGYISPMGSSRTTDNQKTVVNAVLHERARRALYADCDRAPLGWENIAA
ncbi:hypothetical protein [Erythrobacter sp. MTPC3]|uniref:hypothetical protein n=1 Tax=Erythrobacter sp. MTPC3 TaxID=3056564 RepID=UPI0036F3262E